MLPYNLQPLDAARLHRGAEYLHRLSPDRGPPSSPNSAAGSVGPRTCMRFLNEYGRLSPGQVRAAGGDRRIRRPLLEVPR
jgi:hypothetical protein